VDTDDEELVELEAPKPANTSTSHTLVLFDEPHVAPESSVLAHVAPESSAPVHSPRALKKKKRKAKTCVSEKEEIITRSLLTPLLDDVRYLFLSRLSRYLLGKYSNFLTLSFYLSTIFAALHEGDGQYRIPLY
jgi:hypothetical protein